MKKPSCNADKCRKIMFDPKEQEIAGNYINLWPQDRFDGGHQDFIDSMRPTALPTIRKKDTRE